MTAADIGEEPPDDSRSESVKAPTTEATLPTESNARRPLPHAPRPLPSEGFQPSPRNFTPGGLPWEQTTNWDPQIAMRRNTTLLDGRGSQVFAPPDQPNQGAATPSGVMMPTPGAVSLEAGTVDVDLKPASLEVSPPTARIEITSTPPDRLLLEGTTSVVAHASAALAGAAGLSGTSSVNVDPILLTNSERLHGEMLRRIEALEKAMANVGTPRVRGIGDNNPPEPLETELLSEAEWRGIRLALAVLKTQQAAPSVPPGEAVEAAGLLAAIAERLKPVASYLGKQADTFVTEATKELAKRAVQSPLWLTIIEQLPQLADAAQHWLRSLGAH